MRFPVALPNHQIWRLQYREDRYARHPSQVELNGRIRGAPATSRDKGVLLPRLPTRRAGRPHLRHVAIGWSDAILRCGAFGVHVPRERGLHRARSPAEETRSPSSLRVTVFSSSATWPTSRAVSDPTKTRPPILVR